MLMLEKRAKRNNITNEPKINKGELKMASKSTKKKIADAIETTAKTVVDLLNDSDDCEESCDSEDEFEEQDSDEVAEQCVLKKGVATVTVNVADYSSVIDAFEDENNALELNFNPNRVATFKSNGRLVAAESPLEADALYVCDAKGEGKGN